MRNLILSDDFIFTVVMARAQAKFEWAKQMEDSCNYRRSLNLVDFVRNRSFDSSSQKAVDSTSFKKIRIEDLHESFIKLN